jgi:hypothetical protein
VRVIERGDESGFPLKALCELFVGRLYCDIAIEPPVTRTPDLAHPSFADELDHIVGSEPSGCAGLGAPGLMLRLRRN